MDVSELDRAARACAAVVSEVTEGDLAALAGDRTVGDLIDELVTRASALGTALGAGPPVPDGAPEPPDAYGGGLERPLRRSVRRLVIAAGGGPSDPRVEAGLADLTRDLAAAAAAISGALGLD